MFDSWPDIPRNKSSSRVARGTEKRKMPGVQSFKLFIGNLDENTKATDIRPLFEKYGKILECDIVKNYGDERFLLLYNLAF